MFAPRANIRRSSSQVEPMLPRPDFSNFFRSETPPPLYSESTWLLPTIPKNSALPRIHIDTLAALLSGQFSTIVYQYYIFDCRFGYEFEGGHINNAFNVNNPQELLDRWFQDNEVHDKDVFIFHCEFSKNRSVTIANLFRNHDRNLNKETYPLLQYPQIYILDGGYKNFFDKYPEHTTGSYLPMMDSQYYPETYQREHSKYNESLSHIQAIEYGCSPRMPSGTHHDCLKSPYRHSFSQSPNYRLQKATFNSSCCLSI